MNKQLYIPLIVLSVVLIALVVITIMQANNQKRELNTLSEKLDGFDHDPPSANDTPRQRIGFVQNYA